MTRAGKRNCSEKVGGLNRPFTAYHRAQKVPRDGLCQFWTWASSATSSPTRSSSSIARGSRRFSRPRSSSCCTSLVAQDEQNGGPGSRGCSATAAPPPSATSAMISHACTSSAECSSVCFCCVLVRDGKPQGNSRDLKGGGPPGRFRATLHDEHGAPCWAASESAFARALSNATLSTTPGEHRASPNHHDSSHDRLSSFFAGAPIAVDEDLHTIVGALARPLWA